jgi:hypothetical protein
MLSRMSKFARARAHLLAVSLLALTQAAEPASLAVTVGLSVQFISSSGVCAAEQAQVGLSVVCQRPAVVPTGGVGPSGWHAALTAVTPQSAVDLLPPKEQESRQMVPMPIGQNMYEALPVRTAGVEISGWRLVSSDNGSYVELTVAW